MRSNTDWFRDAKWGVFIHYLAGQASDPNPPDMTPERWNDRIDAFDVGGLADQLRGIDAGYVFITLGQNSGYYLSPNETYDRYVRRTPSRCSRRDIVAELVDALDGGSVRVCVYLPSHAPARDMQAVEHLCCTPPWDASCWQLEPGMYRSQEGADERLTVFQRRWEEVVREWSERWGRGVHAWWFDGCYKADVMYRSEEEPNFASFAAAAKSGNPDALVAFNPGVRVPVICWTEHEDYTAGEVAGAFPVRAAARCGETSPRFVDGAQYHVLTFLGYSWGRGAPRMPTEMVVGYTRHVNDLDGVVSWDTGPTEAGLLREDCMPALEALRDATR